MLRCSDFDSNWFSHGLAPNSWSLHREQRVWCFWNFKTNGIRTEGVEVAFIVKVNSINYTAIAHTFAAINCGISYVVLLLPFCESFIQLCLLSPTGFINHLLPDALITVRTNFQHQKVCFHLNRGSKIHFCGAELWSLILTLSLGDKLRNQRKWILQTDVIVKQ